MWLCQNRWNHGTWLTILSHSRSIISIKFQNVIDFIGIQEPYFEQKSVYAKKKITKIGKPVYKNRKIEIGHIKIIIQIDPPGILGNLFFLIEKQYFNK